MTKQEYLAELNTHLMSLSSEERENAVRFYEEYFEDAGAENEQTVMDELGKPYALAKSIICEQSAYSKSLSYAKYRESKSLAQSEPIENNSASAEEDVIPQKAASEQQDAPHTQYTAYNYSYENNNTNTSQTTNNNDTASSKYNTSYESYDEYKENYGSSSTANSSASNTSNTAYKTKSSKSDGDIVMLILGILFGMFFGLPLFIFLLFLFIALAVGAVVLVACAVIFTIFGIITLGASFGTGMLLLGISLICGGAGFILVIPGILGLIKFVPWVIKSVIKFFNKFAGGVA